MKLSNLIKVNFERQTTSARQLWEFLDRPYNHFTDWFNQYKGYGFTESVDFRSLSDNSEKPKGGRPTQDYEITIDMAKELCMLQKTEKGKIARKYFLDLEKKWNSPEAVMARALKMADMKILEYKNTVLDLNNKLEQQEPKVLFADSVQASTTTILVGQLAKILKQNGIDIGQNRLFEWLRENGYLINRKGTDYNMPTQKSMDLGLFKVKETSIGHSDGHVTISSTPKVTGKGQLYFVNKFKKLFNKEAAI
ncbi:phage antirepressor KilAC domain-containing protein [Clostridium sp. LBM24168]